MSVEMVQKESPGCNRGIDFFPMANDLRRVKHKPSCPASDYWDVPEKWRLAFERDVLNDHTRRKELSTAGPDKLALSLLFKFATEGDQQAKTMWVSGIVNLIER